MTRCLQERLCVGCHKCRRKEELSSVVYGMSPAETRAEVFSCHETTVGVRVWPAVSFHTTERLADLLFESRLFQESRDRGIIGDGVAQGMRTWYNHRHIEPGTELKEKLWRSHRRCPMCLCNWPVRHGSITSLETSSYDLSESHSSVPLPYTTEPCALLMCWVSRVPGSNRSLR